MDKKLTKDIIFLIALELNDVDLANFCKTNKYFNEQICKKDDIWNYKLYKLKELKEYSEDIKTLSKEVNTSRELYQLVKSLIVAKEIFKINWSLTKLYNEKEIFLWNTRINKIPNLVLFKNLQKLEMRDNKIEKIPQTLPNSLKKLDLSDNQIKEIPEILPNSLEELWLNRNKIEKIPFLNSLKELYLSDNQIKEIPENLPNSLKELYLSYNKIEKIPDILPKSLQKLYLNNNKIEKIPKKYKKIINI
jgi:Leucine-rich repeat (LRR) protein